jgi:ribonuclease HII
MEGMDKKAICIGIDEVGRGPIAGPVCVGAFMWKGSPVRNFPKGLLLRDSKKLYEKQREKWFDLVLGWKSEDKCNFAVSYVEAKEIDEIGIAPAVSKALNNSLHALTRDTTAAILLDGGLKAPAEFVRQKTIIKGDEKESIISLASIVAKVSRDNLMKKYSKTYPEYGFHLHKGYGTKAHYDAIKKYGLTPLHRASFLGQHKRL